MSKCVAVPGSRHCCDTSCPAVPDIAANVRRNPSDDDGMFICAPMSSGASIAWGAALAATFHVGLLGIWLYVGISGSWGLNS